MSYLSLPTFIGVCISGAFGAWLLAMIAALALPPWPRGDLCDVGVSRAASLRRTVACWLLAVGCLALAGAGVGALVAATPVQFPLATWSFFGAGGFVVDHTAAWFLIVTGIPGAALCVFGLGTLGHQRGRYSERGQLTLIALTLAAIAGVLLADNLLLFLGAWELLSVAITGLTLIAYDQPETLPAGYLTGALTKVSGGALIAALALLAGLSHSFAFADWTRYASDPGFSATARGVIFVLALVGFGTKIGVIPLQGWMPRAYSAAQGPAAALLAGVALNVGFYGLLRVIFDFLGDQPGWIGGVLVILGGLTAFLGILYGLVQRNIKQLIAYSSVENGGIILIGIGTAALALHAGVLPLAGLALVAALLHIAGHSVAKSLLFLGASGVEQIAGTTDMEALGGLSRRAPWLALTFFIGAATLTALPPLSNFASEWMTFLALLQVFRTGQTAMQVVLGLAGVLLALASSCAVVAFVKVYGLTFLGQPRRATPPTAGRMTAAMRLSLGVLAGVLLVVGIGLPAVLPVVARVAASSIGSDISPRLIDQALIVLPAYTGVASIAPTYLALALPGFGAIVVVLTFALFRRWRHAPVGVRTVAPWVSGAAAELGPHQYSALGFSNPMRVIFGGIFQTRRELDPVVDPTAPATWRFPRVWRYTTSIINLAETWVYLPLARLGLWLSDRLRRTQSGSLSLYLIYLLVLLVVVLLLFPLFGL